MKTRKKGKKSLTKGAPSVNNDASTNLSNMSQEELIKRRQRSKEGRSQAFSETLESGVSAEYMAYLKEEAAENRQIEKYL